MRVSLWPCFLAGLLLLGLNGFAASQQPADTASLPQNVEGFRQSGAIRQNQVFSRKQDSEAGDQSKDISGCSGIEADYVSSDGLQLLVESFKCSRHSGAYSLLTLAARDLRNESSSGSVRINREIGTASLITPDNVAFVKGQSFIRVSNRKAPSGDSNAVLTLARLLAEKVEAGETDIPVLVKHLPQWEEAQERAVYLAGFSSLTDILPNQPILKAVKSEGDGDAAAAAYGKSELVLVEFNTPQLAADNHRNIQAGIEQLRREGQPVPSAYQRVGNYSVLVFNAESEQAAKALIDQVKYEQVVTWLGDNPNLLAQAQRDYYETTAGLLVAVMTASGLSLIACLAIGGLLGALLFTRRRAQQQTQEAFSDAGGMLRLNIDEMSPKTEIPKLLGPGQ